MKESGKRFGVDIDRSLKIEFRGSPMLPAAIWGSRIFFSNRALADNMPSPNGASLALPLDPEIDGTRTAGGGPNSIALAG